MVKRKRDWAGRWLGAWFICVCLGCGSSADPSPATPDFAIRDSAGVTIIENGDSLWRGEGRWRVDSIPLFVVEGAVGDQDAVVWRVGNIVRLSDGRFVIENRGTRQLFSLDPSGRVEEILGRDGEGVGEYRFMEGLFRCRGDTLVEYEPRRITVLDGRGNVVRTVGVPDEMRSRNGQNMLGLSVDCDRLLVSNQLGRWDRSDGVIGQIPRRVMWLSLNSGRLDTLGVFRGSERVEIQIPGQPKAVFPFSLTPSWATRDSLAYYGSGLRPEVLALSRSGAARSVLRWNARREPIRDEDWAAYEADRARYLETSPEDEKYLVTRRSHPRPDFKPYFSGEDMGIGSQSGLRFDPQESLWVRRHTFRSLLRADSRERPIREAESWWVFNAEGRWLGTVDTPSNFLIRFIGDSVLVGISRDEFDVESVVAYRLLKPGTDLNSGKEAR